jgi:glycosyltransferase involved in cell wall biosynthesis
MAITLAMLTYRRPHLLKSAIAALSEACAHYPRSEVLIVDNDPDASAEPVVRVAAVEPSATPLRYAHEPRPGISAARNRALDEAHGDLLVFIDDDELPTSGWLDKLVDVYRADRPTAVTGPVCHEFETPPDPWIVSGGFFIRRRNRTGTLVGEAACNNLLLDLAQVRALGTRFDDRLCLIGGEDSLFSKQLVRSGGSIVWCDDAEVVDRVPQPRICRAWVIRRAFRLANTQPLVDLMMSHSAWSRSLIRGHYVTRGLARIGAGGLRCLLGTATGSRRHAARGVRMATRGAGMFAGAIGYVYAEYARKSAPNVRDSSETEAPRDAGAFDVAD